MSAAETNRKLLDYAINHLTKAATHLRHAKIIKNESSVFSEEIARKIESIDADLDFIIDHLTTPE